MRKLCVIAIAITCAAVTPGNAGVGQASQSCEFAYTRSTECANRCPASCLPPNASRVVTPSSEPAHCIGRAVFVNAGSGYGVHQ
jgi:hypothetical protein